MGMWGLFCVFLLFVNFGWFVLQSVCFCGWVLCMAVDYLASCLLVWVVSVGVTSLFGLIFGLRFVIAYLVNSVVVFGSLFIDNGVVWFWCLWVIG